MGLILIIIIVFVVYKMFSGNSSTNTSSAKQSTNFVGFDISRYKGSPNIKDIMYLYGYIAYHMVQFSKDVFIYAGMPSGDAEFGANASISLESLSFIITDSKHQPQIVKDIINSVNWDEKNDEKLEINFSISKSDFLEQRQDILDSFVSGYFLGKRNDEYPLVKNPRITYLNPNKNNVHAIMIDTISTSGTSIESLHR